MVIDKAVVQRFEEDQKEFGSEVAIYNLLWQNAADLFKDLGVTRIRTAQGKPKKKRRGY